MQSFKPGRITQERKRLKKSQQKLAKETGLSSTAIYYIEKGKRVPGADTLGRIADALGCNVDYFFEDSTNSCSIDGKLA